MNIEIVNKQVSSDLNISERDVALINKFYWDNIKKHLYSYSADPVDITYIGVLHPTAYLNKMRILHYIHIIRKLAQSKRYKEDSQMRIGRIAQAKELLRKCWLIRKENKFTY